MDDARGAAAHGTTAPPEPAAHDTRSCDALLRAILDFVIEFDATTLRIHRLDSRARQLLRLAEETAPDSLAVSDLMRGETLPILLYQILPQLQRGTPWRGNLHLRRGDGSDLHVLAVAMMGAQPGGADTVTLGAIDRTDVARLVDALRHEEALLSSLLETIPDSVYFKDLQSRFVRVSTALARKSNCTPEAMVGQTDFDRFSVEHASQAYRDEQQIIRTGQGIVDFEEKETWPDGRVTWVSSSKLPLRDSSGRIIGTFGISRDITARRLAETERQQMEIQLNLAQKMESIGRLAAGIAHEVNTPTQFINDNTHFLVEATGNLEGMIKAYRRLLETASAHEPLRAEVETVRTAERAAELDYFLGEMPRTLEQTLEGVARIARIVRSLKEFSHPGSPETSPADINHTIEVAINVTRHEWKYVAEVDTDLAPDLPLTPCILDEFNQVLLNLIVNAAQAIADAVGDSGRKGRITLRTRLEGDWVRVDVEDTGTGIPKEVQPRIFEPFFTTKSVGKGTGQGLALVHSVIVKKHAGRVSFTSTPGHGTTFHVFLPIKPAESKVAP